MKQYKLKTDWLGFKHGRNLTPRKDFPLGYTLGDIATKSIILGDDVVTKFPDIFEEVKSLEDEEVIEK